jgi:hypothetical protein
VEKTEGKRQLGRTRRRIEDTIIINLKRNRIGAWSELNWLRILESGWSL